MIKHPFRLVGILAAVLVGFTSWAQCDSVLNTPLSGYRNYQPSISKDFRLIHTDLEVRFDYGDRSLAGKVTLTLEPYFYDQQSLVLDAKGMTLNEVSLLVGKVRKRLAYTYDDKLHLVIALGQNFEAKKPFKIYIDYIARPNDLKVKGSAAITDAKGLYFINPDGKDSSKPTQIWTQGETEATSVWCPTIDATNQRCTQKFMLTVPGNLVTLSNGLMTKQQMNADGTRTDTWEMKLPHAPYLFFMGVGDFAIVKDKYKNLAVDYYVDKDQAPMARQLFGETPKMMAFFSRLLGYEYPWPKYAQMVAHDYVSGAMENTTATLHSSKAYQSKRALLDRNEWESTVAHELFHQWFGDLVTAESWSNLTVNESFADYSEYLWFEYKYGKDYALKYGKVSAEKYLRNAQSFEKHLVRFRFDDRETMFDNVSYEKGGRILNMLRNYLGDSAFFTGLQLYLKQNQFKTGEAHQLRLALEEASGRDLNWFFDQWYFGKGHPKVVLASGYDKTTSTAWVAFHQMQTGPWFHIPVVIDVYDDKNAKKTLTHWLGSANDTLRLPMAAAPSWIDVDPERTILWERSETLPSAAWQQKARLAGNALQKEEVLAEMERQDLDNNQVVAILNQLLKDAFFGTRAEAMKYVRTHRLGDVSSLVPLIVKYADTEPDRVTRAEAIRTLGFLGKVVPEASLIKWAQDSSLAIAAAGLQVLTQTNAQKASELIPKLKAGADNELEVELMVAKYALADPENFTDIFAEYKRSNNLERMFGAIGLVRLAKRITDIRNFKKAVAPSAEILNWLQMDYLGVETNLRSALVQLRQSLLNDLKQNPQDTRLAEQLKYIDLKMGW